ncbi:MAG: recombination mediator RecR [Bacteriovoracaceae bacterium]|nr:recombination mediator RecR [Bacteriovoracaceae bacterium]
MELPESLKFAVSQMTKIPGVGEKTALRQILTICRWDREQLNALGRSLINLGELNCCVDCGFYTDETRCQVCQDDSRRDQGSICVVETISDFIAIENSNTFKGTYHILGGVLNPLLGVGPDELRIPELAKRIMNESKTEVILAVNPSVEGDATCSYINQEIPDTVKVERIGFGIPMGGNLEYLDSLTISKALENRKRLD